MTLPTSGPLTLGDIQTEFGGSNPIAMNEYYAGGTYVAAGTSGTYGAVPSSGQISVQNFYGTSAVIPAYIEEVFSTYLYTGNGSTQTITNGINLSANGGLTWCKARSNPYDHYLFDTARGANNYLISNGTGAQNTYGTYSNLLTSFNTNGFSLGADSLGSINVNNVTYASWTFQEKPKFFDIVTYTGTGAVQNIAHNLGSVPGCIIVKTTNATTNWIVQHRSSGGGTQRGLLNSTSAFGANSTMWDNTNPTSSVFTVGTNADTNQSGNTFVAYLFAHDAGGFGLTGTDNVISCGSYTGNGSTDGPVIDLGYEPQWLLIKSSSAASTAWILVDNMRGMTVGGADAYLKPNSSDAETTSLDLLSPTATGFKLTSTLGLVNGANDYIYIAIRRGPMKVPTSGTSVFAPVTTSGTGTNNRVITGLGFSPDMIINCTRGSSALDRYTQDRLRGVKPTIYTNSTSAEQATQGIYAVGTLDMTGFTLGTSSGVGFNSASDTYVFECFKRAPSFFDEVCYTGTGSGTTITHNLGVTPELVITKSRTNGALGWVVWTTNLTNTDYWIRLDSTMAQTNSPVGYGGTFSASNYTIANTGPYNALNGSGQTFVAYLFASCAGVSKVGSFTGNGSSQTINCGFTGGARFVLIKATSTTGDWMVADSARGIVSGSDPYLELNNTNAEVTGEDWLDTDSTGFVVNEVSGSNANTNGVTYIFLAIA